MDELPLALLSDILSRVSGESLLQYRIVCKRWQEVIDDSYFRNSIHRLKERAVLYHEYKKEGIYLIRIHEEAAAPRIELGKFAELRGYAIQGTCNGLLLFQHSTNSLKNPELLINPFTRVVLELPRAPDLLPGMFVYGLGFDRSTKTYKMVQIKAIDFDKTTCTGTIGARIYDFNKQSWRTCKAPTLPRCTGPYPDFIFASGALNWFLQANSMSFRVLARVVLSFDLTKEEFSFIPIPDDFSEWGDFNMGTQMHELGGSLALVHRPDKAHIDVWVLSDYTRREWTRKYRIRPPGMNRGHYLVGPYKRDKLILHCKGNVYLYDVNSDRCTTCWTEADACYALFWYESLSLVSLKYGKDAGCNAAFHLTKANEGRIQKQKKSKRKGKDG
ncbi:hypothetical protein BT93_K2080 [Corymbia citriodora subsp. variegata]|nr:hypothetical protein BT93_K2080 [Corymbia citriodora subsp. variegata]